LDAISKQKLIRLGERVIVFNATFNNISVISWGSVLLVEADLPQVTDKLYHIMLYQVQQKLVYTQSDSLIIHYIVMPFLYIDM
jgi:hypothetical protein